MHAVYEAEDLPPIVQRALSRLMHPEYFSELLSNERFALAQLVRRIPVNDPTGVVWCKRSNFAKLIQVSEATVYRLLAKFEKLGLLFRDEQTRSASGALSLATLRFTDRAIELLGLKATQDGALYSYPDKEQRHRLAPVQDLNQTTNFQFATQKQSGDSRKKIPQDLEELVELGLTHPQVFKLMAIASAKAQRLGDVWELIKERASRLRAANLFAYLRATLAKDKDWCFLAGQAKKNSNEAEDAASEHQAMDELHRNYAGRTLHWGDNWVEVSSLGDGFLTLTNGRGASASAPPQSPVGQVFWKEMLTAFRAQRR